MTMQKIFDNSPMIQRIKAEAVREAMSDFARGAILRRLEKRFGSVPSDLAVELKALDDPDRLDRLIEVAFDCPDLAAFRTSLTLSA